jgi:hypothetical protein
LFVCLFCLFLFCFCFLFFETGFLRSPGHSGTHFVDQAGLELRNLPAFRVLGLKACTTMPGMIHTFNPSNLEVGSMSLRPL